MVDNELKELKESKDAVILAHYYADESIQKIADYVGDSFYLANLATNLKNKKIIMAGVYFMGESVKLLNPEKQVFVTDINADCPMAHMVTVEKINNMREKYKDLAVVCYINSTAEIKSYSDVCVTSSNAIKIVRSLSEKNIFFIPDGNLGRYIKNKVPEKNIIPNSGFCPVHNKIKKEAVQSKKNNYPESYVLAHPECSTEILKLADYVDSTSGIISQVGKRKERDFIIITEKGISWELRKQYPNKNFHYIDNMVCPDMKLLTVEKIKHVLRSGENEVFVNSNIAEKAKIPLQKMLKMGA